MGSLRIESIRLCHIRLPFKATFSHALHARQECRAVIVELRGEGLAGYGEIQPRPYLTGETLEKVWDSEAPTLASRWLGQEFQDRKQAFDFLATQLDRAGRMLATFGGFELSLLDLCGKAFQFQAGQITDRPRLDRRLPAGIVIDFAIPSQELRRRCAILRMSGQRHIKVKVGRSDDFERLKIISGSLGEGQALRIDANGAWSARQAVEELTRFKRFNIESVEQPVPAQDIEGMRQVRQRTGLAVMADESLCSLQDGLTLIRSEATDIFNIRLAKCGGFSGSARLAKLAEQKGLGCHLGTVVGETGILNSAAEDFGRRFKGFACLEGKGQNKSFLTQDIVEGAEEDSEQTGLGVSVVESHLERFSVDKVQWSI